MVATFENACGVSFRSPKRPHIVGEQIKVESARYWRPLSEFHGEDRYQESYDCEESFTGFPSSSTQISLAREQHTSIASRCPSAPHYQGPICSALLDNGFSMDTPLKILQKVGQHGILHEICIHAFCNGGLNMVRRLHQI